MVVLMQVSPLRVSAWYQGVGCREYHGEKSMVVLMQVPPLRVSVAAWRPYRDYAISSEWGIR